VKIVACTRSYSVGRTLIADLFALSGGSSVRSSKPLTRYYSAHTFVLLLIAVLHAAALPDDSQARHFWSFVITSREPGMI
jgi:hypothetical protein